MNLNEVHLTIIKNPCELAEGREQRSFLYEPVPISTYLRKAGTFTEPGFELNVVYGGRPLSQEEIETVIPAPGDHFVTIPMVAGGGNEKQTQKQVLSLIASIAMMYAGVAAGNVVAGQQAGAGMAGMQYWKTSSYLVSTMVQMAGGMLINRLMNRGIKQEKQASNTYGWAITTNMTPGGAIQETCGTIRTGGTCIGYYVTSDGEKQYANILLSGGEGPCDYNEETGEVTGIDLDSIEVNGNSIKNFDSVVTTARPGTNNQAIIPAFNDSRFNQSWGDELKKGDDWLTHDTDGTAQAIEVIFDCPYGLCRVRDDGKFGEAYATIEIQYKKTTDTDWTPFTSTLNTITYAAYAPVATGLSIYGDCADVFYVGRQNVKALTIGGTQYTLNITSVGYNKSTGYTNIQFDALPGDVDGGIAKTIKTLSFVEVGKLKISAHTPNAYKKIFTIELPEESTYNFRVRCTSKSGPEDNQNYKLQTYWTGMSQIVRDDLSYPNQILLAIKALASDKLNGTIQSVTWKQTVSKCWVWNPNTSAYEQKAKDNPAWRCYDIYHKCRRLWNINTNQYEFVINGEAASKIDYTQFAAWAAFCDEYSLKCNYAHDTIRTRDEALAPIELIGRGCTFQSATMITCSFNGPVSEPVQVFNRSTISQGGITVEYLSKKDRANAIEIKFRDADRNYEWHEFTLYGPDYEEETGVQNPIQLTLDACTSYNLAYRHGMLELKMNKYITKSESHSADIDSIASRVGDVIGVQNDINDWGKGGRIVDVGGNWIKLDQEVSFASGVTYEVCYRLPNDSLVRQYVTAGASPDIVVVETPFTNDTHTAVKVDGSHFEVVGDQTLIYTQGCSPMPVLEFGYGDTNPVVVVGSVYDSVNNKTTVEVADIVPDTLESVRFVFSKPRKDDPYHFGEEHELYKLFKITSISMDGDLKRKIQSLEYIPEVYSETETIPPPTDWGSQSSTVKVSAHEWIDIPSGKIYLNITWETSKTYSGARVYIDGVRYDAGIHETSYIIEVASLQTYQIIVKTLDMFGNPSGEGNLEYTVTLNPPPLETTSMTIQPAVRGCVLYFS